MEMPQLIVMQQALLRYYGNVTNSLLRNRTFTPPWKCNTVHRSCYQGKPNMSQYFYYDIQWQPYDKLLGKKCWLSPCSGTLHLLAACEMPLRGTFSLPLTPCTLLISKLLKVGWNFQLIGVVCLNYWLSTDRDQHSGEDPALQGSFWWLCHIFFPVDFL
jgi:hypothetical protein